MTYEMPKYIDTLLDSGDGPQCHFARYPGLHNPLGHSRVRWEGQPDDERDPCRIIIDRCMLTLTSPPCGDAEAYLHASRGLVAPQLRQAR
jgi:hypothetical protein